MYLRCFCNAKTSRLCYRLQRDPDRDRPSGDCGRPALQCSGDSARALRLPRSHGGPHPPHPPGSPGQTPALPPPLQRSSRPKRGKTSSRSFLSVFQVQVSQYCCITITCSKALSAGQRSKLHKRLTLSGIFSSVKQQTNHKEEGQNTDLCFKGDGTHPLCDELPLERNYENYFS